MASQTRAAAATPAEHDLDQPEAENVVPHPPQAGWVELEPDEEEQEDDSDLGDLQHRLAAVDEPEQLRPDESAGDEIAQGRSEPEAAEEEHEDEREAEQDHSVAEQRHGSVGALAHGRAPSAASAAASAAASKARRMEA